MLTSVAYKENVDMKSNTHLSLYLKPADSQTTFRILVFLLPDGSLGRPCGRGAVVERTPSVTKVVSSIPAQSEKDFIGGRELVPINGS